VRVNKGGFPVFDPTALLAVYALMAVSVFMFGLALFLLRHRLPTFGDRAILVGWTVLGAITLNTLGDPIWSRVDWAYSLYVFVGNTIVLVAGGLVLARWFVPREMRLGRG